MTTLAPPGFHTTPQRYLVSTALAQAGWISHSFGTRHSQGLAEERRYASLRQVHSARWMEATGGDTGFLGEGDALLTDAPGVLIGVRTADCLPILLADPKNHAVAAVHAGWRGTAQQIIKVVVEAMRSCYGSAPQDLLAAIGPGIGGECYEVGPEVVQQLLPWLPKGTEIRQQRVDLASVNFRQLRECGLPPDRISLGAPCTLCCAEDYHSFRRDGQFAGRMVSSILILPASAK